MIQRIQTLFLLFSGILLLASLAFPVWQKVNLDTKEKVTLTALSMDYVSQADSADQQVIMRKQTIFIAVLLILGASVSFYSLSRYKQRMLQVKLGALNALLIGGSIVLMTVYTLKAEQLMNPERTGTNLVGFYLPVIALFLNFMANRFIRKDELLIRSADRLR